MPRSFAALLGASSLILSAGLLAGPLHAETSPTYVQEEIKRELNHRFATNTLGRQLLGHTGYFLHGVTFHGVIVNKGTHIHANDLRDNLKIHKHVERQSRCNGGSTPVREHVVLTSKQEVYSDYRFESHIARSHAKQESFDISVDAGKEIFGIGVEASSNYRVATETNWNSRKSTVRSGSHRKQDYSFIDREEEIPAMTRRTYFSRWTEIVNDGVRFEQTFELRGDVELHFATSNPGGTSVCLRAVNHDGSNATDHYLSMKKDRNPGVFMHKGHCGKNQTFLLHDVNGGLLKNHDKVTLRNVHQANKYVKGTSPMTSGGAWAFRIVKSHQANGFKSPSPAHIDSIIRFGDPVLLKIGKKHWVSRGGWFGGEDSLELYGDVDKAYLDKAPKYRNVFRLYAAKPKNNVGGLAYKASKRIDIARLLPPEKRRIVVPGILRGRAVKDMEKGHDDERVTTSCAAMANG